MPLNISVVVPTYLRPDWLKKCILSLTCQTRLPAEIIVVMRDTDLPSHQSFSQIFNAWLLPGTKLVGEYVSEPGFLPPVLKGMECSTGDIVCFLDDDAEAFPDWIERLEQHYSSNKVGGVGGRCVNIWGECEVKYPIAKEVGHFYWFGRCVGNMYKDSVFDAPQKVDFFMGGNMSYRREVLGKITVDSSLNKNVAFNYEVDLGLQVKALGYDLIYDPLARIKHYSAPRPDEGLRTRNTDSIFWYSHNLLHITLKHIKGWRRLGAIGYGFLVGDRMSWGLIAVAVETVQHRRLTWVREITPSFSGKFRAVRNILR
jgi:GT2 family glycosyltransferase